MFAVYQIVPVRNEIAKWATVVAERDATVHAATCLALQDGTIKWFVHLFPVFQSQFHWTTRRTATAPLQKSGCLTHVLPPLLGHLFVLVSTLRLLILLARLELVCNRVALLCGSVTLPQSMLPRCAQQWLIQ